MTDTQIIIDEIDVTSCIYACRKLNKDGLHDCRIPNTAPFCCENIHNCYYKQLKRKEQECEKLKETFDDLFKGQYKLADNCKKLRQCLTEIKEIIHFNKTNRLSGGADISIEQILQKISEVEDGK